MWGSFVVAVVCLLVFAAGGPWPLLAVGLVGVVGYFGLRRWERAAASSISGA
jgi:MYXO-CTERM domain-containing protein